MVMLPLSFITPPPPRIPPKSLPVKLSEMVQSVSVNTPALRIPPPPGPSDTSPFEIVIPEIETVTPGLMLKIRKQTTSMHLAVTVKRLAPGPVMMRFLLIANSPLIRVTVVTFGAKVIVSPDEASRIAWRNDPAPLSFPLQTAYPPGHGVGAGLGVGIADGTQYLPPVFNGLLLLLPPQTTISLPVQTAV
jgi:hypothetical protein